MRRHKRLLSEIRGFGDWWAPLDCAEVTEEPPALHVAALPVVVRHLVHMLAQGRAGLVVRLQTLQRTRLSFSAELGHLKRQRVLKAA